METPSVRNSASAQKQASRFLSQGATNSFYNSLALDSDIRPTQDSPRCGDTYYSMGCCFSACCHSKQKEKWTCGHSLHSSCMAKRNTSAIFVCVKHSIVPTNSRSSENHRQRGCTSLKLTLPFSSFDPESDSL